MTKKEKFYKTLKSIFIGAKIEGKGGFVNLMRSRNEKRIFQHSAECWNKNIEKC